MAFRAGSGFRATTFWPVGQRAPKARPPAAEPHRQPARDKHIRREEADKKEQEGSNDQNGFADAVRAAQSVLFMGFLANIQQFNLLSLFATNGGLR